MNSPGKNLLTTHFFPLIFFTAGCGGGSGLISASDPVYYVSASTGADTNPGTLAQPFATIQAAAQVAQAGSTIYISSGNYRETVTPAYSGSAGRPITFTNYNSETVTVNGTDIVTGWTHSSGSVYSAPMTWDLGTGQNQVFINGQMILEAQWPAPTTADLNLSSHQARSNVTAVTSPPALVAGTTATYSTSISDSNLTTSNLPPLQGGEAWSQAKIYIASASNYFFVSGEVTSLTPGSSGSGTITYQAKGSNSGAAQSSYVTQLEPSVGNAYFLSGLVSLINAPGQWARSLSQNALYLRTLDGGNPTTELIEVKARPYGFDLSGLSYVTVQGLSLFATGVNTSSTSDYIILDHVTASYVSQLNYLDFGRAAVSNGIILNGSGDQLTNSSVAFAGSVAVSLSGSNGIIQNNIIHDVDYLPNSSQVGGLVVRGSGHQITNNTMYNSGRFLIYHNATGIRISNNLLHDAVMQTEDAGATYMSHDGQGTQISNNVIYNVLVPCSGGCGHGRGIYLDSGSANYLVNNNVVYNTDVGLATNMPPTDIPVNIFVVNNTFDTVINSYGSVNAYVAPSNTATLAGSRFLNNIIGNSLDMGGNTSSPSGFQPVFQNNFFSRYLSSSVVNYLQTSGNSNTNNSYSNSSSTLFDPEFVSPYNSSQPPNYSLLSGSPAKNKSQAVSALLDIGGYAVSFSGISANAPAGACDPTTSWTAGASLGGLSPVNVCR